VKKINATAPPWVRSGELVSRTGALQRRLGETWIVIEMDLG
jgi:hypothetical protein